MSSSWSEKYDVVIAGSGISAAATALRLLSFGLRPILVQRPGPIHGSAEAIPEAALRLFRELNLESALRDAGGVAVQGFETSWGKSTISKSDWFVHVDRIELAKTTIAEAVKRGAGIVACERLPRLHFDDDFISLTIDNTKFRFRHAVDATGRAAAWSRPVDRSGSRVAASMFRARVPKPLLRGKVVSSAQGWAYRIGLPTSVTVGVIEKSQPTLGVLPGEVATALQISDAVTTYIGRRPAFPQWCDRPAKRSQIAVGDAALAHDPLAGQGIRFALGSALAAAAVIRTSCDLPQNSELAESYYNELIHTEKQRHISFLETSYSRSNRGAIASPSETDDKIEVLGRADGVDSRSRYQNRLDRIHLSEAVSFVGRVSVEGVQYNGLIVPREVIRLDNGSSARWLGDFDLLRLRRFAMTAVPVPELVNHLLRERLSEQKAIRLIDWCLNHRILSAASL